MVTKESKLIVSGTFNVRNVRCLTFLTSREVGFVMPVIMSKNEVKKMAIFWSNSLTASIFLTPSNTSYALKGSFLTFSNTH